MIEVDEELLRAFHLMWDNFPDACTLIHRSREVVAVNPAAKRVPREVGMICAEQGSPKAHARCQANRALETNQTQAVRYVTREGKEKLTFWVPINGYPDFYIHFGTRSIRDYE
ncbi:hypothetical protein LJC31_03080 [Synergistaceae bacterium OttesenSCG-928-I11]|nr:hypothetical protein [Synergistaceae bacterium OttesenSCG-928-I11]